MSGLNIFQFFSLRTYIGKVVGLIAGMTAGLSVGREGPYVHMSACIGSKLSKLGWFSDMDTNQSLRKQMYAAAIAAGVTATFGAPMGGVIFSIEVSSTYYMISGFWKAFFCVTCGILFFRFLANF